MSQDGGPVFRRGDRHPAHNQSSPKMPKIMKNEVGEQQPPGTKMWAGPELMKSEEITGRMAEGVRQPQCSSPELKFGLTAEVG